MLTLLESPVDIFVHVDRKILFGDDLVVSVGDCLIDPVTEWLPYNSVDYISQVCPWELLHLYTYSIS